MILLMFPSGAGACPARRLACKEAAAGFRPWFETFPGMQMKDNKGRFAKREDPWLHSGSIIPEYLMIFFD
jgi:hypothetical protein